MTARSPTEGMNLHVALHLHFLLLFCLIFTRIAPVPGQGTHAKQGAARDDSSIVRIPGQGSLLGKEVLIGRTQRITQYLGIPYAQPPVGKLRFSLPVTDPLPSWSGTRNATQFAPSCQQVFDRLKLHEKIYKGLLPADQPDPGVSEDCLFLNVYMPDGRRPPEGWPVVVWFHGGDFNTGTPMIWDASIFVARQQVLVVTVAYRLNILGFFTTTDAEAPGNYGMFDQLAALDWVQKNIAHFDGSPSNVVIHGHSSGAICVGLHMVSPMSRGKFNKVIAMSGDAIGSVGSPQTELPVVDVIAEKFGCYRRPTSALMECLRRVDVSILVRESASIETWGPIVDAETNNVTEPFLPQHPRDILLSGDFNAVPLLAGYTKNEQALAYLESLQTELSSPDGTLSSRKFTNMITDDTSSAIRPLDDNSTCEIRTDMVTEAVLFFYKPHPPTKDRAVLRDRYLDLQTEKNFAAGLTFLAEKVSKQSNAYVYRFDYRPRTESMIKDVPEWVGVPHMFELPFVWGLPFATGGSSVQWHTGDRKLSNTMLIMFGNFIRTGNPSIPNVVKWESYSVNNPAIMIIDKNINMNEPGAVDYKALAFWNEYYPMLLEQAVDNCCNMTSSSSERQLRVSRSELLLLLLTTLIATTVTL